MINLSPNSIARWHQRLIEFHFYGWSNYSVYCRGRLTKTWLQDGQLLGNVKITSVCRSEADWYNTNPDPRWTSEQRARRKHHRCVLVPGGQVNFTSVEPTDYIVKLAGNRWKRYQETYYLYQKLFAEQIRIEKVLANKSLVFSTNTDKKIWEAELYNTIAPEPKTFLSSGPSKVISVAWVDSSAPKTQRPSTVQKIFENLKNIIKKINS